MKWIKVGPGVQINDVLAKMFAEVKRGELKGESAMTNLNGVFVLMWTDPEKTKILTPAVGMPPGFRPIKFN